MGELGLRRVDPADEHVQHEVHALHVRQPIALLLGGDQRRDQVLARIVAAALDQRACPLVELLARSLDRVALAHQARPVELALDQVGPLVELGRVLQRRAHHRRDRQRRVRLAEGSDELALAIVSHGVEELLEVLAHHRPPPVRRARREGGVDEVAQAPVLVAVDVQDVAPHLLEQRTLLDLNSSAIFIPGKVALRVRRKNDAASRSSTVKPNGPCAIQLASLSSCMRSWNSSPRSERSNGSKLGSSSSVTSVMRSRTVTPRR